MPAFKNLLGKRFGLLIAKRATEERQHGKVVWECECDCGQTIYVTSNSLRCGNTTSCGCSRKKKRKTKVTERKFDKFELMFIDTRTNTEADIFDVAKEVDINTTIIEGFALNSDNQVIIYDECGCYKYAPDFIQAKCVMRNHYE